MRFLFYTSKSFNHKNLLEYSISFQITKGGDTHENKILQSFRQTRVCYGSEAWAIRTKDEHHITTSNMKL